jgi:hypothetical protein
MHCNLLGSLDWLPNKATRSNQLELSCSATSLSPLFIAFITASISPNHHRTHAAGNAVWTYCLSLALATTLLSAALLIIISCTCRGQERSRKNVDLFRQGLGACRACGPPLSASTHSTPPFGRDFPSGILMNMPKLPINGKNTPAAAGAFRGIERVESW